MNPSVEEINRAAVAQLVAFRALIADIPYEAKGVLYSEMFFLYLCAQTVDVKRILESGRARGQSTVLLARLFPHLPIISLEHDRDSGDVQIANRRLSAYPNVTQRFDDATRLLPAEVMSGDIVLIDGPKGFRGLRLALRLLATGKPALIFMHDTGPGSVERRFLQAHLPNTVYSDEHRFVEIAHVLDAACEDLLPVEQRFSPIVSARGYGFGLCCIAHDPRIPYRLLLWRCALDGFLHRLRSH